MQSVCFSNTKGGQSKTFLSNSLAGRAAQLGVKTLILELDPQASQATNLRLAVDTKKTFHAWLEGNAKAKAVVQKTNVKGLDLVSAHPKMAAYRVDSVLSFDFAKDFLAELGESHDLVVIDTPANEHMFSACGLVAAKHYIIPVRMEMNGVVNGIARTERMAEEAQKRLNSGLKELGIMITDYYPKAALQQRLLPELRAKYGARLLEPIIPRSNWAENAVAQGVPATIAFSKTPFTDALCQAMDGVLGKMGVKTELPAV